VAELEQENARLRTKIEHLEANLLPTTQAQMAIAVGQPEDVVRHALGRTQILSDSAILAEALRAIGPQRTWDALQAEAQFYRNNVQFRALNGEPTAGATWDERAQWHRNVWVPHMTTSVATFCDQLYRLGLPSPAIESFRRRMEENLCATRAPTQVGLGASSYRGAAAGGNSNPLPSRVVESSRPSRNMKLQGFAPV
jgi:hypothetical protein